MLVIAFALSFAQPVDRCSSTDDVCLLQLKGNAALDADVVQQKDPSSLLERSSETDSDTELG
jgi:hypothetical protein